VDKLNIANIARGALLERSDIEIDNVLKNILDKNTDWRKARKVTLEIGFKATDESRETVFVELKAKSSISPYNPVMTQLSVGKDNDGKVQAAEFAKGTMPGQQPIIVDGVDTGTGEIVGEGKGRKVLNINR
jgi:hypothetical protein